MEVLSESPCLQERTCVLYARNIYLVFISCSYYTFVQCRLHTIDLCLHALYEYNRMYNSEVIIIT